jgi:hypothetical protein
MLNLNEIKACQDLNEVIEYLDSNKAIEGAHWIRTKTDGAELTMIEVFGFVYIVMDRFGNLSFFELFYPSDHELIKN